jgi:wobble nucleotide-excising tRNase
MVLVEFDQARKGGNLAKYKNNQARLSLISTSDQNNIEGLLFHQLKRRDELRKIKAESTSISKYLKHMGIDHFLIEINEDVPDENIVIKYSTSGKDKTKLRNCLSDGEKTALAFAYFLSKFESERNTEDKRKESVVVIDDPISSLDENRLYSTAYLIRDNFAIVKQLFVLSHNFLFLKFLNNSFNGKTNCFFINEDKLGELPNELKNFESPYFYMLKDIIEYLKNNTDYINYWY